jgi:hypothetical protein
VLLCVSADVSLTLKFKKPNLKKSSVSLLVRVTMVDRNKAIDHNVIRKEEKKA